MNLFFLILTVGILILFIFYLALKKWDKKKLKKLQEEYDAEKDKSKDRGTEIGSAGFGRGVEIGSAGFDKSRDRELEEGVRELETGVREPEDNKPNPIGNDESNRRTLLPIQATIDADKNSRSDGRANKTVKRRRWKLAKKKKDF